MTRPTILDLDLVVVPREAAEDIDATIKEFGHWHHLNEMTIAKGMVPSDSEIDIEVMAFNKIKRAMLSASPYPTAWDEVRKAYDALEEELKWLRDNSVLIAVFNSAADRAEAAEARIAELEKRLADAERVIGDFMDITEPASIPAFKDPQYADEVERLGERIGFGALIASASASWREVAKRDGHPVGGEFVVGPCMAVLQSVRRAARAYMEGK